MWRLSAIVVLVAVLAMGANARVRPHRTFEIPKGNSLLQISMGSEESQRLALGSRQGTRLRGQMEAKMFRKCDNVCIRNVLDDAKVFVAGAFSKGDCMYTNNDGDSVDFLNPDTGEPYLTEEECDEAEGDWVENINGGAIDILKNSYRAMNDPRDGGAIKMFFTVFAQGFYYVKDRLVTGTGHAHRSVRHG